MSENNKPDQSFNAIANKFETNIYGSTKGQLRHQLLWHYLQTVLPDAAANVTVLDAGGGTGEMTRPLLEKGFRVTLNDISEDVLAIAQEKLSGFKDLSFDCGSVQDIRHLQFDIIICHAVLEWLQKPLDAIAHLISLLPSGGILSLSFFNQDAHRFGNLLYGNFDYVKKGLKQRNTVRLNPNNAQAPGDVLSFLASQPVDVIHEAGIRCFHDYLKDPSMQSSRYDELFEMELKYGTQHPYKWLGKYFHVMVRRR